MSETRKDKLVVLIDGSSYLYRAFHALPPLSNSKGEPTGAVYGVVNMIRKLINDYHPDYVGVVFDPKGKTHRDEIYAEYKSHRPPMPDELVAQITPLYEIITEMGLPIVILEGCEADDVIGTLAYEAKRANMEILISTGDKDMAQLVNDKIKLINTMTGVVLDREGVIEKFGIPPESIVDYLALIGDKVDNIPGVPNVGPKTAAKWLQDYQSLENLIQHVSEIKGKVGENLRQHLEQLELSKQLVTIMCDLELPMKLPDLKPREANKTKLIELYKNLEFKSWLSELLKEQTSQETVDYHTIFTREDFEKWLEKLKQSKTFAFDTETTHFDPMLADIVGISFAIKPFEAVYVPMRHDYANAPAQLDLDWVLEKLTPLFNDQNKVIIGQHIKYDMNVLSRYNMTIKAQVYDIMLESYVLNSAASRHDMDSLALKYLGKRTIQFEDIAGKGSKQLSFNQIAIEEASKYAAEDADITLQLHQLLWKTISMDEDLQKIFLEIEMPLSTVLAHIEQNGVLIDVAMLKRQGEEIAKRLKEIEEEVYLMAGQEFNLSSPKQLQTIFYDKLQIPVISKTPTGQPSTSEAVLQELAHYYPMPKLILEYRSLSKLKTTYTDRLPLQINPHTGRVHTCYNQAVTTTGRLSSTDPNLQNIPIRTEEGRKIRQAFIAPKGYKIVSADYSQIELRLMAHLSQDEGLLKAFEQEWDIHRATAAEVFNVTLEEVTSLQRRSAKTINFGLIYGMSAFGLGRALNIDRETAQKYIDLYFERYPKIRAYMEGTKKLAHRLGSVTTVHGRRLFLPEINARNLQRQRAAERAAINAPLQGTAADIIKLAMINIDQCIQKNSADIKMIMQVHDELVFEVGEKDVDEAVALIQDCMCKVVNLAVPLKVEIGIGNNWDEAH